MNASHTLAILFYNQPLRLIVEALLLISVVILIFKRSYKITKNVDRPPTQKELEEAIQSYHPEPIINDTLLKNSSTLIGDDMDQLICHSASRPHVTLAENTSEIYLNLATLGFLNYQFHPSVLQKAEETLRKCGVGICSPRGFYGTHVVHLELESRIAEFMGTESAVVYSSGFNAIGSVIPAFCKPGDYLFVDSGVNFTVQNGIILARTSNTFWFPHNKMSALEHLLHSHKAIFDGNTRVFVVIEGLYSNQVDVCPLPELLALKEIYPFRIIMEESNSIGVLGKHGRGITEHFNVPVNSVEIIVASLSNALGTFGGFSVGSFIVGRHQRLSASGYCFSCSTPPYLVVATIEAFDMLERGHDIAALQKKCLFFHQQLNSIINSYTILHSPQSPFAHLLLPQQNDKSNDEKIIKLIVQTLRTQHKIIVVHPIRVPQEKSPPRPSIRISISIDHTDDEIIRALQSIELVGSQLIPHDNKFP